MIESLIEKLVSEIEKNRSDRRDMMERKEAGDWEKISTKSAYINGLTRALELARKAQTGSL